MHTGAHSLFMLSLQVKDEVYSDDEDNVPWGQRLKMEEDTPKKAKVISICLASFRTDPHFLLMDEIAGRGF